jgi:16S rRNA (uracil1498-N3)-methyltransferase
MPCYFAPQLTKKTNSIVIEGREYHHLSHVKRAKLNDKILLTSGDGLLAEATICKLTKQNAIAKIESLESIAKSQPQIAVAFSLLKNKNDYLIVEKCAELGVSHFFPLSTARTIRKATSNSTAKFKQTALAAIKQCDNAYLPEIEQPKTLEDALLRITKHGFIPIVGHEMEKDQILSDVIKIDKQKPYCLIFGPEGGFDDDETDFLRQNEVTFFSLGNHILRAETAAIAATAQLIALYLQSQRSYY